jgi:hypothetical protein
MIQPTSNMLSKLFALDAYAVFAAAAIITIDVSSTSGASLLTQ